MEVDGIVQWAENVWQKQHEKLKKKREKKKKAEKLTKRLGGKKQPYLVPLLIEKDYNDKP